MYPGIAWYVGIIQEEISVIQSCMTSAIYHNPMPSIVQRCSPHGQVPLVFTTCQIYPGITWYLGSIQEEISIIQSCMTSAIYHNNMPSIVQRCTPHGQVPLVFTTCQIYPGITWYLGSIQEEISIIQSCMTSAIYHNNMPSIVQRCTPHGEVPLVFKICQIYPGITRYVDIIQEELSIIQSCVTSAIYHNPMPSIVQRCTLHGQVPLVFTTCQIYPGITWYVGIIHEDISIIQSCMTSAIYHNMMPSIVQRCSPHGQVPLVFTICQMYPGITWYVDIIQEEISIIRPRVTSAIYHNQMPSIVQHCTPGGQLRLVFTTCHTNT